ncbi:hypothetical protein VKT23_019268 [Stygiomarasmius scandens]|uniref:Transmembrane protein n=1 Tax=Marasmiellus scandens TaxID=2682957 RepID=A0ABR1IM14_9AGAR
MTFTWRSTVGSSLTSLGAPPSEVVLSHGTILGIRVGISVLLGLGVFLVVLTFVTLGIAESRDSFERPIGASYLPRRRGTRPARQRLDSQTTDDRSEAGTDQAGQHVPSETHQVSNPEEPVAFPALPSTSMIDVSVQTPPVNSPSPQESPPQEIHPYLSPTGSSDAQAQATRSDPSLPIRQEQGRVNRTISASQVTSSPGTSAGRNTSSNNARGSVSVAGNRSAGSGSGSGSGNRSGQARSSQTAQRQSTGRRTSGTDVARPRRQSRTHSTQSHRTSQGRTGNSGRR